MDVESTDITLQDIREKLKTVIIPSIGHHQLIELFQMGDKNHNLTVEKDELKKLFIEKFNVCPTNKSLDEVFNAVDVDHDGHINLNEWLTTLWPEDSTLESRLVENVRGAVKDAGLSREKLKEVFQKSDTDHNQLIDVAELKEAFLTNFNLNLSPQSLKAIFAIVDQDHDGHINLQEWLDAFFPTDAK